MLVTAPIFEAFLCDSPLRTSSVHERFIFVEETIDGDAPKTTENCYLESVPNSYLQFLLSR